MQRLLILFILLNLIIIFESSFHLCQAAYPDISQELHKKILATPNSTIHQYGLSRQRELFPDQVIKFLNFKDIPELQEVLGMAYLDIIQTQPGRELCDAWVNGFFHIQKNKNGTMSVLFQLGNDPSEKQPKHFEDFKWNDWIYYYQHLLAVDKNYAKKIHKYCQKNYRPLPPQSFHPSQQSLIRYYRQTYLAIIPTDNMVTGWSNDENEIWFFFRPEEWTYQNLVQVLAHELAIIHDQKTIFRGEDLPNKIKEQISIENLSAPKEKALFEQLSKGALKRVLASFRAFKFERQVLEDLQKKYQFNSSAILEFAKINIVRKSVWKKLRICFLIMILKLMEYLRQMEMGSLLAVMKLVDPNFAKTPVMEDILKPQVIEQDVQLLQGITVISKKNNEKSSLCQYMATPWIGPLYRINSDGPRPRMGGGGWGK